MNTNRIINTSYKSLENAEKVRYLGRIATDENLHEEITIAVNLPPISSEYFIFPSGVQNPKGEDIQKHNLPIPFIKWEFFSSPPRSERLWSPPSFPSNGYQGPFPRGVKRPGREADH
jgi:hypothetical protein